PFLFGSSAYTIPDFCPTINKSRLSGTVIKIAEEPKSKSGPQFLVPAQAPLKTSSAVSCLDHTTRPVARSRATSASLSSVAGPELRVSSQEATGTYTTPACSVGAPVKRVESCCSKCTFQSSLPDSAARE